MTEYTFSNGKHKEYRKPYSDSLFVRDPGKSTWRGYWCEGARKQ